MIVDLIHILTAGFSTHGNAHNANSTGKYQRNYKQRKYQAIFLAALVNTHPQTHDLTEIAMGMGINKQCVRGEHERQIRTPADHDSRGHAGCPSEPTADAAQIGG